MLLVVLFRMKGLRKATLWLYTSRGGWWLGVGWASEWVSGEATVGGERNVKWRWAVLHTIVDWCVLLPLLLLFPWGHRAFTFLIIGAWARCVWKLVWLNICSRVRHHKHLQQANIVGINTQLWSSIHRSLPFCHRRPCIDNSTYHITAHSSFKSPTWIRPCCDWSHETWIII